MTKNKCLKKIGIMALILGALTVFGLADKIAIAISLSCIGANVAIGLTLKK